MIDTENQICIVLSNMRNDFNDQFVQSMQEEANRLGYCTTTFSMPQISDFATNNEERVYELIDFSRYKGAIYLKKGFANHPELAKKMDDFFNIKCNIPVVTIGGRIKESVHIYDDCFDIIVSLADHLIDIHGCDVIYFLGGKMGESNGRRIEGFVSALEKHGIAYDQNWILYGGYWVDCAEKLAFKIAYNQVEKPDAIMCINDEIAFALIKELYKYGIRVPEDILVTGFDGGNISNNNIMSITSAQMDTDYVGRKAIDVLHSAITGAPEPESKPMYRKINTGLSCGCGTRKPLDIRYRLEKHEKDRSKSVLFRNSRLEEHLYAAQSRRELVDLLKGFLYIVPDCTCMSISTLDEDFNAECFYQTYDVDTGETFAFDATHIYPDRFSPKHVKNSYVLPVMFDEEMRGFLVLGYDEPSFYEYQAKYLSRAVGNALEIVGLREKLRNGGIRQDAGKASAGETNDVENVNFLYGTMNDYVTKISVDNILYVEAMDKKVYIVTKNGRYETKQKLFEIESTLERYGFLRVSKSTVLSMKKVISYRTENDRTISALLTTKESVRVSRNYVDTFIGQYRGNS